MKGDWPSRLPAAARTGRTAVLFVRFRPASYIQPMTEQAEGRVERRSNPSLRALIDEMLEQVRALNRNARAWTPEERARAEADLVNIMSRVRGAARVTPAADTAEEATVAGSDS